MTFHCDRLHKKINEESCYFGFLNAHANEYEKSKCYGCPRGATQRLKLIFHEKGLPSNKSIANMLLYCGIRGFKKSKIDRLIAKVTNETWWITTFSEKSSCPSDANMLEGSLGDR